MSDGNFNRSLLPHTPYHSGLQAGKSMGRMKAVEAFKAYLSEIEQLTDEEEIRRRVDCFKKLLSARL